MSDLHGISYIKEGKRAIALFGTKYYEYGGRSHCPKPCTMKSISLLARNIERFLGTKFNSVLVNYYKDGSSYIPPHSDDEASLGPVPIIASISVGATRSFSFIRKCDGHIVDIILEHGTLLIMKGETQQKWQHTLPFCNSVNERFNITFRFIN